MNSGDLSDVERRRLVRWLTDRAGHLERCRARMVERGWGEGDRVLLAVTAAVASLREAVAALEVRPDVVSRTPRVPDGDIRMGKQMGSTGKGPAVYPKDLRRRGRARWWEKRPPRDGPDLGNGGG